MQAQSTPPPDMQCKDKFLIQSTVVPSETKEDDIKSDMVGYILLIPFLGLLEWGA